MYTRRFLLSWPGGQAATTALRQKEYTGRLLCFPHTGREENHAVEKYAAQGAPPPEVCDRRYVATRGVEPEALPPVPVAEFEDDADERSVRAFVADVAAAGLRLDHYLAQALPDVSRARVQLLIEAGQVRVNGAVPKSKDKLRGGEAIEIEGEPRPEPLHATPEDIPLEILFEDKYLAVVNKPAGMMVHAGAGATDDERNTGTLVNALLFHMAGR